MQGRGLGADLPLAAGERGLAVAQEVGGVALAIDARDTVRPSGTNVSALCGCSTTLSNWCRRSTRSPLP